jgi:hypothetical protein
LHRLARGFAAGISIPTDDGSHVTLQAFRHLMRFAYTGDIPHFSLTAALSLLDWQVCFLYESDCDSVERFMMTDLKEFVQAFLVQVVLHHRLCAPDTDACSA